MKHLIIENLHQTEFSLRKSKALVENIYECIIALHFMSTYHIEISKEATFLKEEIPRLYSEIEKIEKEIWDFI